MADCLRLNTDMSPVSLVPLSTLTWQKAIQAMVQEKVTVLEWHEDWIVRSMRWETRVPAVVMLKEYHKKKSHVNYSKANVFLRDLYKCQYCGVDVSSRTATLDHVWPVSLGGKSTFENTCCSCGPCNALKADKKIKPIRMPVRPTYWQLVENRKQLKFDLKHPSWESYIMG